MSKTLKFAEAVMLQALINKSRASRKKAYKHWAKNEDELAEREEDVVDCCVVLASWILQGKLVLPDYKPEGS